MINILIAPNSFKECSDSTIISQIIHSSFQKNLPKELKEKITFTIIPISDGGDGFLSVCKNVFNLEIINFKINTPYNDKTITCDVGYDKINSTIYIESANVLGLKVVPPDKRNPLVLSSEGLGELLQNLKDSQLIIKKVVIGIGGTATNDLGMGACSRFGLLLKDKDNNALNTVPKNFNLVNSVILPTGSLNFDLELVIDVENPLLGKSGATKMFGGQKGLSGNDIDIVEESFKHILSKLKIRDDQIEKLSGAGGGLAAGLQIFFNAKIKSAKDFIVNDLGINSEKYKFDIVITGEGKLDEQSLFSKGAMIVLDQFLDKGTLKVVICGSSSLNDSIYDETHVIEISNFFSSKEDSIKNYEQGIELAVKQLISNYLIKE